eukprot:m.240000 g.240000  ORF g.240000 m.240000 type:complete len:173 (-) comp13588_c0_seq1:114-632(-)
MPIPSLHGPAAAGALEYSVHPANALFRRELARVFGDSVDYTRMLIIPTFQSARVDLVAMGAHAEEEKDRLFQTFYDWATGVCKRLQGAGHWADFTDPATGLPALGDRFTGVYPDVIGMQAMLNYDVIDTGCCKIITHPRFGTKVYPATMFTTAPLEDLLGAIQAQPPPASPA